MQRKKVSFEILRKSDSFILSEDTSRIISSDHLPYSRGLPFFEISLRKACKYAGSRHAELDFEP